MKSISIEVFCNAFDSILTNLTTGDLKSLSARPVDMRAVTASRKTSQSNGVTCCHFTVDLLTAVGWLDVLDVSVRSSARDRNRDTNNGNGNGDGGGEMEGTKGGSCVVSLSLASTGFLPLSIPAASLCNIFFCWIPFLSVEQTQRLDFFRNKLSAIYSIEMEEKLCNL